MLGTYHEVMYACYDIIIIIIIVYVHIPEKNMIVQSQTGKEESRKRRSRLVLLTSLANGPTHHFVPNSGNIMIL